MQPLVLSAYPDGRRLPLPPLRVQAKVLETMTGFQLINLWDERERRYRMRPKTVDRKDQKVAEAVKKWRQLELAEAVQPGLDAARLYLEAE